VTPSPDRLPVLRAEPDDLLAAEPAALTGTLIWYARVSTRDQKLDRQLAALNAAGCLKVFADKKSGKNAEREELAKALDYLRAGDTLAVPSLDRLGRSIQDLITIVAGLRRRGIDFTSLHEALDTTTPGRPADLPCLRRPGRMLMGPGDRGISADRPVLALGLITAGPQPVQDLLPGPVQGPAAMPVIDRLPVPEALRQVPPRAPCPGPEEDPVDHRPVIGPPAAPRRIRRQEHPKTLPFLIGQVMAIQAIEHRTDLYP
jgi:Resolvase, N terminal domain